MSASLSRTFSQVVCIVVLAVLPWSQVNAQETPGETSGTSTGEAKPEQAEVDPEKVEEATRLYKIGLLQFEGKEFSGAAQTFLRALALDPNATLAYNVARAYENNGELEHALTYYERALELSPEKALEKRCRDALIRLERSRQKMREKLAKEAEQRIGVLKVKVQSDTEILVDGALVGSSPLSVELTPGRYQVELRKPGYLKVAREVLLTGGDSLVLDQVLEPVPEPSTWKLWTGGGLLTASAGMFLLGGALDAEAQDKFEQAQSLEAKRDADLFAKLREEGENSSNGAEFFAVMGGISGSVGVGFLLWYFLSGESDEAPEDNTFKVVPTVNGVDLHLRW